MVYLACDGSIIFKDVRSSDLTEVFTVPVCDNGWSVLDALVAGAEIDYVLAGQYFTAAFVVSASIILTGVGVRNLLNFIRR